MDREQLQSFIDALPPDYAVLPIDKDLYHQCLKEDFAVDFCSLFDSAEDYLVRGMGFCILYKGQIVCGASSYTIYDNGIEIEIDTHEDYRQRGLATACAARLILECLDTNKEPCWDAANKSSVGLAEKLGYQLDAPYDTYEIDCS